ncbi:MAG: PD-(D/E)XK nuclease family protein [Muribaculaceae bacterium]|nr:PD-(D/E)XK nuclease family protein [Muribaculaceae bacterium]
MAKELTATYKDYIISIESNGSIIVTHNGITYKNTKDALRTIAHAVSFAYDKAWNTRQFGANLVKFLNENRLATKQNFGRVSRTTPPPISESLRVKQPETIGGNVIVLNRMYCGDYLDENLGHEIINMYKSDNGKSYLYLNAHGTFDSKWANRIKTMLLVRTIEGRKMLEVTGIALGIADVYQQGQSRKEQDQYIINNNIRYAGKYLHEIFKGNQQQDINISFVANKVLLPNKKVFLSFNPDIRDKNDQTSCVCYLEGINQAKASLKQYIEQETAPIAYNKLIALINQPRLWTTEASMVKEQATTERRMTYFDICGITHNELAFSNAIAFFFEKYPHHLSSFMDSIGVDFDTTSGISIYREKRNIDILISNGNKSIVIENKITSGINGIDRHDPSKSQLKKYYDILNGEFKGNFHNPMFYVLTPNYNDIHLTQYAGGEHYTKLLYSQLFEHLKIQEEYNTDILFQNYVSAIEQHTTYYCNDQYEEMKQRFLNTINN